MPKIDLLDCTLRDGGYINNWNFGWEAISDITGMLSDSGVEIVELGFIRDEPYIPDRTVYNSMIPVRKLIRDKQDGCKYALMAEAAHQIDVERLEDHTDDDVELVRVIIWKTMHDDSGMEVDALRTGYDYCKKFKDKGYKLCIQPARVEQYTDSEYIAMLQMYSELDPYAIYVVDSWGTMYADQVIHYMRLAEQSLRSEIRIGFHGHNNLMQAFAAAESITKEEFTHDLIFDSSVYGIGRCAGNLNTELLAGYLNRSYGKKYDLDLFMRIYEKYISDIYDVTPWGFSEYYM